VSANDDWCLGQTVRQMDTDQVVDMVTGLTHELDQQRIRAELAEAERDALGRHLRDTDDELALVVAELETMLEPRAS
jgi:hypothetical protein